MWNLVRFVLMYTFYHIVFFIISYNTYLEILRLENYFKNYEKIKVLGVLNNKDSW